MTLFIHNPPPWIVRAASERPWIVVERMTLRQRMVRDLERFLSIHLSLPTSLPLGWGRKSGAAGIGGIERAGAGGTERAGDRIATGQMVGSE